LSGCIEIIEDLTINSDRSGSYKLTINLSASKMKVKSLMAMDSLRGQSVPSEADIKKELDLLAGFLTTQKGLSAAKTEINFDDLICKIYVEFEAIEDLQAGFQSYTSEKLEEPLDFIAVFELTPQHFKRNSVSQFVKKEWIEKISKEDMDHLQESSLVLITRFDKPLIESDAPSVSISKNKMAGMFRTNLLDVIQYRIADNYTLVFEEN